MEKGAAQSPQFATVAVTWFLAVPNGSRPKMKMQMDVPGPSFDIFSSSRPSTIKSNTNKTACLDLLSDLFLLLFWELIWVFSVFRLCERRSFEAGRICRDALSAPHSWYRTCWMTKVPLSIDSYLLNTSGTKACLPMPSLREKIARMQLLKP